jgi:Epoxide hydrolase N terminus
MTAEPFQIRVSDDILDDLRARLARSRFTTASDPARWAAGTDPGYLAELVSYWADGFDWRAAEAALNAYPQHPAVAGVHVTSEVITAASDQPPLSGQEQAYLAALGAGHWHHRRVVPAVPSSANAAMATSWQPRGRHGRGLAIVAALADKLGHDATSEGQAL